MPAWLTDGGIVTGFLVAAASGPDAVLLSLTGALVGGLLLLPFVLGGGVGVAEAYLLAVVGAWGGWRLVVWTARWAALAGALLALLAYWRGQQSLACVPAIAVGTVASA